MSKSTFLLVLAILIGWFLYKKSKSEVNPTKPSYQQNKVEQTPVVDELTKYKNRRLIKRNPELKAKYAKLAQKLGEKIDQVIDQYAFNDL